MNKEEEVNVQKQSGSNIIKLKVKYGNTFETMTMPQGKTIYWTAFVDSSDRTNISKFIDNVTFIIQRTPKDLLSIRECKGSAPYKISQWNKEPFKIPIIIYWKSELGIPNTEVDLVMSFKGQGALETIEVEVDESKLEN